MSLFIKLDLDPTREPKHSKTLPGRPDANLLGWLFWVQTSSFTFAAKMRRRERMYAIGEVISSTGILRAR